MNRYQNINPATGRFQNQEGIPSTNPNWKNIISAMGQSLRGVKDRFPKDPLPELIPDFPSFLNSKEELSFIWFGHSSIYLKVKNTKIFFDPVLLSSASPFPFLCRRFQPPVCKIEEIPLPDTVVLSHNHHDHYDEKVVAYYGKKNVKFIVPLKLGTYLRKHGVPSENIEELDWGESYFIGEVIYRCTPAFHSSGRWINDQNISLWSSWVIESKDHKIFFSGDTGYGPHFKEVGEEYGPIDLVFMENGQYDKRWPNAHLFPNESATAFKELRGKCFVPIHWGAFALGYHPWFESVSKSYEILKDFNEKFFCPRLGQVINPLKEDSQVPWWIDNNN